MLTLSLQLMIDFRSDTVTQPCDGMLEAMLKAKVGDDVFGEDPTINELENRSAEMFGLEAGLFCPSGTMTNQIAIKAHTQPGEEVICDELSHIYQYEGGGIAFNSGCSVRLLHGDRGRLTADLVKGAINNPDDIHKPISRLVSLENTVNKGGGCCYELADFEAIKTICLHKKLSLHLDGARIFNALVFKQQSAKDYGQLFDTISICLSKGLGTPVGSILLGSKDFIKKSRRIRKVLGGGWRQAGILAAAGIYALENNINRLTEDHKHAQQIAAALLKKDFVGEILPVETNIVIATIKDRFTPTTFVEAMAKHNIKLFSVSNTQVRLVLHLNITNQMVEETIQVINSL